MDSPARRRVDTGPFWRPPAYFGGAIAELEATEAVFAPQPLNPGAFGALPLAVVSRGQAERLPGVASPFHGVVEDQWRALQHELLTISCRGTQVLAERTGHDLHLHDPGTRGESFDRG